MKKIITLLLSAALISCISLFDIKATSPLDIDEFDVLDTSRLVIKYSFEFVADAEKPDNIGLDVLILEIGPKISKSYSYGLFKHDSIATMNKNSPGVPRFRPRVPPMEVFKNYPKGKNTIVHRTDFGRPIFLYEDEINIDWTILPERKQLFGYSSQKAIVTFRGRTWEAWFTGQIPISDGPWKFHGLPGLILKISDTQNHFRFTIASLTREKVPIKKWKWDYERSTRERTNEYLIRCHERPFECAQNLGMTIRIPGRPEADARKISTPFNPIELE